MIRLFSISVALLIVGCPLLLHKSKARPASTQENSGIELLLGTMDEDATWLKRQKIYNPQAYFSFSRQAQDRHIFGNKKRENPEFLHKDFMPHVPAARKISTIRIAELPPQTAALHISLIPPSENHEKRETPQVRSLTVCNDAGENTGMTIEPVSFRGKTPRPVLFQIRSGRCGNDLRLVHSSGDRFFDAGVRRKLLQKGIAGNTGKLLCIWPESKVKEINL